MRITKKQAIAAAAAGSVIALLGSTGIAVAASSDTAPSAPGVSSSTISDPATTVLPGSEIAAEGVDDGADQGPDANPNEPGHQDADEADDATEGPENASDDAASVDKQAVDNQSNGEQADD